MARHRSLLFVGAALVAAVFLFLRLSESPRIINHDELIPLAVSWGMTERGDLDTNWALAERLPPPLKYDQYNFSTYNLFAHAVLGASGQDWSLLPLRHANVALQALAILLVVLALRRAGGTPTTGLAAAALLAVAPALVQDAHIARTESLLYALFALVLWLATLGGSLAARALLAGLVIGVGTASKITFIATALIFVPAVLDALRRHPRTGIAAGALAVVGTVIGFALGAPHALFNPDAFLNGIAALQTQYATEHIPHSTPGSTAVDRIGHTLLYVLMLYGPALAAFLLVDWRRAPGWVWGLGAMSALVLAYFAVKPVFFERNIGIALMGVVILLACALPRRAATVTAALTFVVMAWWAVPIAGESSGREDRRAAWEAANIPGPILSDWPAFDAPAKVRTCEGTIALLDFGDPTSRAMIRAVLDAGYRPLARYEGPFHPVPTSTLQTYLEPDAVYVRCGPP